MPKGRRPVATEVQAGEVRRLAVDGVSKRDIAAQVFGDARYHGRVDRILRRVDVPRHDALAGAQLPAPAEKSETLRWLQHLLERHRERLASEEQPPLNEVKLFMEIERRLEAAEMVERANALTREGGVSTRASQPSRARPEGRLRHNPRIASYTVNQRAVAKAGRLIESRQYVLNSEWGEVQPKAEAENAYLASHSWEEYGEWHLGLTEEASEETKARYAFVYGDFRRLHRTGLIACHYRAAEWRHKEIELAAHELLQLLDKASGGVSTTPVA